MSNFKAPRVLARHHAVTVSVTGSDLEMQDAFIFSDSLVNIKNIKKLELNFPRLCSLRLSLSIGSRQLIFQVYISNKFLFYLSFL